MKKAILISIQPQWIEKILKGEKTIEIRKSMPKCDLPIDVYIYCTKGKINLYSEYIEDWQYFDGAVAEPFMDYKQLRLTKEKYEEGIEKYPLQKVQRNKLNGKVVAKFTLNKVSNVIPYLKSNLSGKTYINYISDCGYVTWGNQTCLEQLDFENYLGAKSGYAWHIDNLEIFNLPMELREFKYNCTKGEKNKCSGCVHYYCNCNESINKEEECLCDCMPNVKKAPQSWQYVYVEEE